MKKTRKNPLFHHLAGLLMLCIILEACEKHTGTADHAENLILMIGDGMGFGQIQAARLSARAAGNDFILDTFPVVGLVNTESADDLITDSAASATAISTGVRTINGRVAMDVNGKPLTSLLEICQSAGKKTGLIASSSITHATPAAFATHALHRSHQTQIAQQLIYDANLDLMLGGGLGYFLPSEDEMSFRSDDLNLLSIAREQYSILATKNDLLEAPSGKWLGLFAQKGLLASPQEPSLAEMTHAALRKLENPNGFCLIIEGSQIDWAAHENNTEETIRQTLQFDQAIRVAVDFQSAQRKTLLLVTADHETGGMTVTDGDLSGKALSIAWATKKHIAEDVPLFAKGVGAHRFSGIYRNDQITNRITETLKLSP